MPADEKLRVFLAENRIATLEEDFRHDLHMKVLGCFASLGFDDDSWFSDEDLVWLLTTSEHELSGLKTDIASRQATLSGAESKRQ